jgi:hypothetical protein
MGDRKCPKTTALFIRSKPRTLDSSKSLPSNSTRDSRINSWAEVAVAKVDLPAAEVNARQRLAKASKVK